MAELVEIRVVTRGTGRARRDLDGIGASARRSGSAVQFLRGTLLGIATAGATRELLQLADASTRINNRLNLLTGSQRVTNALFNELTQVAANTRSAIEPTVDLFSRLQRSTQDLGLTTQQLLGLTTSVNQAFQIYGNTAAEAEAATIQFAQGLAAGALRGDELRSVLEQAPRLAQALVDGLNETQDLGEGVRVTIGDLRELGRQGVLTAEIITSALGTQAEVLNQEFQQTLPTIEQSFKALRNEALIAFRELDDGGRITGGVAGAIRGLAGAIGPTVAFLEDLFEAFAVTFEALDTATGIFGDATQQVIFLTAAIAGLSAALRINPLVLLAATSVGAIAAIRGLQDSTTALTVEVQDLVQGIQLEREQTELLTASLDEGRILTVETARAKLIEAEARRENILRLRDEARVRLEAQRAQIQGLIAQARAIQAEGDLLGFNINPLENLRLIELSGQVRNAFEAFQALEGEVESFDALVTDNADNIQRLNDLLASGTLDSLEASRIRRELAAEEANALERLTTAAQRAGVSAAEGIRDLTRDLGRITVEAGNGAEALQQIEQFQNRLISEADGIEDLINRYRLGGVAEQEIVPLVQALEQINILQAQLDTTQLEAQSQAVDDIIAGLQQERAELALTSDELAVRNSLRSLGLTIDTVSPDQLQALREEQMLLTQSTEAARLRNEQEQRRQDIINGLGGRDQIAQLAEEAAVLQDVVANPDLFGADQIRAAEQGLSDIAERMAEIRLQAGQGGVFEGFLSGISEFRLTANEAFAEFGGSLASATEQLTGSFGDAIAGAIVNGEDLGETLQNVARQAVAELISSLVQLGIRFLINQAIALTLGQTAVAANIAQAGALASAYAAPAALASLASFGANAAPASAALVGTTALSKGLASAGAIGLRDGGFVSGPGGPRDDRVPALLSNGEFVVNARATRENRSILEAINGGFGAMSENINGGRSVTVNMNVVTQDADSFNRSRTQITRDLRAGLDRVI